jgi:hypothetical protein
LVAALKGIENPVFALVLAKTWGLFGSTELSAAQIAELLPEGTDARKVRVIRDKAEGALRSRIQKLREPTL